MKVILAALATAAVLAAGAYAGAGAVTPGQLAAVNKRVAALHTQLVATQQQLACVVKGWNAQQFEAYVKPTVHFSSSNADVTIFAVPQSDTAGPYLVVSPAITAQC